jgi:transposase
MPWWTDSATSPVGARAPARRPTRAKPSPLPAGIAAGPVAADNADDGDALIEIITAGGAEAVIPPRANRTAQRHVDRHLDEGRNLVERFFCRIKQVRRISTRYDTPDRRYEAFIAITAAWIWLA